MAKNKTDGNTFEASDQDQTASVSPVTYNAHDMVKSQGYISDPTAAT